MTRKGAEPRNCTDPELVYQFLSYINGDSIPDERKKIEEHLAGCATCREDMQFFTELQKVGREMFGEDRPECTEPKLGDLFAFYINGNVTEQQRETIEKHLAVCLECREELRFFLTVRELGQKTTKALGL